MVGLNHPIVEILHCDIHGVIFNIKSGSSKDFHTVSYDTDGWWCTCEHYRYRKAFCKHMQACVDYAAENGINIPDRSVYAEGLL